MTWPRGCSAEPWARVTSPWGWVRWRPWPRPGAAPGPAASWVAAGALSDALDVAASLASWPDLPRATRWLVAASAGGAALTGAAAALTSVTSRASSGSG